MSVLVFQENDSVMKFSFNQWDSKPFDRTCYEVEISLGKTLPYKASLINFINKNEIQTVTCRVAANDFKMQHYLQILGFSNVEVQLKCRLTLAKDMAPKSKFGDLRLAEPKDIDRVKQIASTSFLQSRFRFIPNLSTSKIGDRFSNWAAQLQQESPEFSYVLEANHKIVGFFYSKPTTNKNELYAALGGIASDSRGPYGVYLYPAVMAAYYRSGVRNIVSAIAADNLGALNLWAGLGTKFPNAYSIYLWNTENHLGNKN